MHKSLQVAIILATSALSTASLCYADEAYFKSQKAGISLRKPANWIFDSKKDSSNGTVVVILRHKEPYSDLNPTCRVTVSSGSTATTNLRHEVDAQIASMQKSFPDLALVESPAEIAIGTVNGIGCKLKYSFAHEGKLVKVLWRMWHVSRPGRSLKIVMAGPQEGPEISETEFRAIRESITIE